MADEITTLRERIVTLESDNAALTRERDEAIHQVTVATQEHFDMEQELAAAQATNERLREALKFYMVPPIGQLNDHCVAAAKLGMAALALPNDTTALDARLKEERKRCAKLCDDYGAYVSWHPMIANGVRECANAIRSMSK